MFLLLLSGVASAAWNPTNDAVDPFNKAVTHYNNRQPDKALKALDRALSIDPGCGMCLTLKAETLVDLDQAVAAWELLIPIFPDFGSDADFLARASLVAFAAQQFEDARNLALAAVAQPTAGYKHWQALTFANIRLGNYEDSEISLQNARKTLPEGEWNCLAGSLAMEKKQFDQARQLLEACTLEDQREIELANLALNVGDFDAGASLMEQAGFIETSVSAQAVRALNQGDYPRAYKLATEAIARSPMDGMQYIIRAKASYRLGSNKDALADLHRALSSPEYIQGSSEGLSGVLTKSTEEHYRSELRAAAVLRTEMLLQTGQVDEARTRAVEAGRLLGEPEVRELCEVLIDAQSGQLDRAWDRLKPALESGDSDSSLLQTLAIGVSNRAAGQVPEWFWKLAQTDRYPWGPTIAAQIQAAQAVKAYNAAVDLWNAGDEAEARALFAKACEQSPEERKADLCRFPWN